VIVACYGLAFKPDIDDLRESPALHIAEQVVALHCGRVLLVEPNINEMLGNLNERELVGEAVALAEADVHVILVDHMSFKNLKFKKGIVVDTRGLCSK